MGEINEHLKKSVFLIDEAGQFPWTNPFGDKHIKVSRFAAQMRKELDANAHKGDWQEFLNKEEIVKEIQYHQQKLSGAMATNDLERIKEYIADCSNLFMMLGNSYGFYDNPKIQWHEDRQEDTEKDTSN